MKNHKKPRMKNSKNEEPQEPHNKINFKILHNLQYLPILQTLLNYFQVYIILQGLLILFKLSIISKPL